MAQTSSAPLMVQLGTPMAMVRLTTLQILTRQRSQTLRCLKIAFGLRQITL